MQIKGLKRSDAEGALRLSMQAAWNHLLVDWERSITLSPETCIGLFDGDMLVATCTVAQYGELGWIGTFLVDQDYQRQGLGTKTFDALLEAGREQGIKRFALDSSDAGRPIYKKYGFIEDEGIERWLGQNSEFPGELPAEKICQEDWPSLLELDLSAVNVDRQQQLKLLAAEDGASVRVIRERDGVLAFGFCRPGRLAGSIGPVVAQNLELAEKVIDSLLADRRRIDGERGVSIDMLDNDEIKEIMAKKGFSKLRRNIRMFVPPEGPGVFTGPKVFASTSLGMG